jgi:hypothetical protein
VTLAQWLLLPAFIHVGWIFALVLRLGGGRVHSARAREVNIKEVAFDNSKWPGKLRQLASNYENQFEIPVLYYAVLPLLLVTGLADSVTVVLSWAFVLTRIAHSLIHTGRNVLVNRFYAFVAGVTCLMLMWLWFALRLFVIG